MFRSSRTPAQRKRLIERWRASGRPLAVFARQHQIHPRTFWGWVHEGPRAVARAPTFVPVQVVDAGAVAPPDMTASIEIVLPPGTVLRVPVGTSPAWVAALVAGLHPVC